eukprot:g63578.t1
MAPTRPPSPLPSGVLTNGKVIMDPTTNTSTSTTNASNSSNTTPPVLTVLAPAASTAASTELLAAATATLQTMQPQMLQNMQNLLVAHHAMVKALNTRDSAINRAEMVINSYIARPLQRREKFFLSRKAENQIDWFNTVYTELATPGGADTQEDLLQAFPADARLASADSIKQLIVKFVEAARFIESQAPAE